MVKGVNRQIIEVFQSDHPYFERALFVVRGDLSEEECARLYTEADRLLHADATYSALRRGRRRALLRHLAWGLCGAAISAVTVLLAQKLL